MSDDQQLPPQPPFSDGPPPPPPSNPATPPPSSGPSSGASPNRTVMLVLSYIWLLALIPFLLEQEDREVKWHARHGLVLTAAEFAFWILWFVVSQVPGLGCILAIGFIIPWAAFVILHVVCIVKAMNGERFIIPGLSEYADRI